MITAILLAFGTLFPIMNPISTAFVFDNMTRSVERKKRYQMAFVAALTAALVLLVFLAIGHALLGFFGVTVYAFRVAGGLYLGKVAFEMLSKSFYKESENGPLRKDFAIMPLAVPLLAGPGGMTAVLVMSEEASVASYTAISVAVLLCALVAWLLLRYSHVLGKLMGATGARVIERVFGLLVLVIAAQFVFNGVTGYLIELGFV